MELFASQDPRSYSLYFDLNIWFRARKVTGTFEKRAPALGVHFSEVCIKRDLTVTAFHNIAFVIWKILFFDVSF